MSAIDLSKLTARRKFFVPVESSELCRCLLEQLEVDSHVWEKWVERSRSGTLRWNYRDEWARMRLFDKNLPHTKRNLDNERAEFDKDALKNLDKLLTRWFGDNPQEIHFVVTEDSKDGCVCEVTCFPLLRSKIKRKLNAECNEIDMQEARLRCEEFLVDIFVGGLQGREIVGRKEVSRWELLVNDIKRRHITDRVYQMLAQAVVEVLIMGWIGTDCLPKLQELKNNGISVQAITHKPSEMKSPVPKNIQQGYANLVKILGKTNVSTNRELHGRAIIVDNKALIGSMDLNTHSLSGEHREFAIYTEDVDTVRKIRSYFKEIFIPLKQD